MLNEMLKYVTIRSKEVHTTNPVFKLATRFTVNLLFICVVIIGSTFIIGHPIECVSDSHKLHSLLSLKCWAEGVFIDRALLNGTIGKDVISPGVGTTNNNSQTSIHQAYYQWIVPLLAFQAFILYLPRGIWKIWENGLMGKMLNNMNVPVMMDEWKEKRKHLIRYVKDIKQKYHRSYALKYLLCEVLSLLSIIFNMFLLKWVINDFWIEYQPAIAAFLTGDFHHFRQQSAVLFPLQAKCNYTSFGHSGSIVYHDVLCFMPQNIVNEKIFVFFYLWYIALLILTVIHLCFMLTMFTFNSLRILDIGRMLERTVTRRDVKLLSEDGDFGYWFTLRIFHKNLSPVLFQDLAKQIAEK